MFATRNITSSNVAPSLWVASEARFTRVAWRAHLSQSVPAGI